MLSGGLHSCVFLEIAVQLVGFIQIFLSGAVNSFLRGSGGLTVHFFFFFMGKESRVWTSLVFRFKGDY